ncbi:MAG: hypothetical protein QOE86_831 [Solirubrobacteraceae bacterium]|nr:hypothetical protein [Solirubrobacteraceae bacterium]
MDRQTLGVLDRIRMPGDPDADPAAQVRIADARITVLTARLLRLESGGTEDRATYAFPNRRAEVPPFTVRTEGEATIVDTGALVLRHTPDGRGFHADNTSIELTGEPRSRWVPGMVDRHNLGGARRTVDRCRGGAALEPGLVSRSGWAVVDDSAAIVFDPADGWPVAPPDRPGRQDWYFFGHGHDYAGALGEFTRFGGAIPLVPRWVLGAWWSRYWPYSEQEVRQLVRGFRERGLPLDVFVLDMDWHTPRSWTGYSWNRELFPDPPAFLRWLHDEHLHTTLNLHPALGVQSFEDAYPAFVEAMGAALEPDAPVPFGITEPEFVRNYFELLHHPLEDEGVDFWWIDWQQGTTTDVAGLDPLPWLNHLHFVDMARRTGKRPLIFSRWGGLGSHRYPIGFSGDSFSLWPALRFQPRYTAAGANVAYAWWSHDIGGHVGIADPELYVRWLQFGALSPVLRLHSTNAPDYERLPWRFGDDVLAHARAAFELRYELIPYLYTAARTATDTGVAPVRPTAWAAPGHDDAYLARHQYLLGDAILAAPVVHPADPATGLAVADAWLPDGDWIERTTGETLSGSRWVRRVADLAHVPQYVRPGTALPLGEVAKSTTDQPANHLILCVYTGGDGEARVYEDDGESPAYVDGRFAWTDVTVRSPDASSCEVAVHGGSGPRRITLRLPFTHAPAAVTVDGSIHGGWRHEDGTTTVELADAGDVTIAVRAEGTLSARGPEHDAALRQRDLDRLGDSPVALARRGGPWVQVVDYTAPEEAAAVLGRVVVAAAEHGPPVVAQASWTLERGGAAETVASEPVEVTGDAAVLDAPWAWDGTLVPLRWSVEVTARWGDEVVAERHVSDVLVPTFAAWEIAGRRWVADPGDIDFPELTAPAVLQFRTVLEEGADAARVAATLAVAAERDVAFAYAGGGDVAVEVDGEPVTADVTGNGPMPFYTLAPRLRRTAPVRLGAGRHEVVFTCPRGDVESHDWYLWASAVDPADGSVVLDVTAV